MTCGLQTCPAHSAFTIPLPERAMSAQSLHLGWVKPVLHQDCFHAILVGLLDWLSKAYLRYERFRHAVDSLHGLLITAPLHRCGDCGPICFGVVAV